MQADGVIAGTGVVIRIVEKTRFLVGEDVFIAL